MIAVEKHSIILYPTENEFENESITNTGVYQDGDTLHFLYRAIQKGNLSTIGYAKTNDPLKIIEKMDHPLISIGFDYESHGMEDPKIVKIDDTYYITYIAYDGMNKAGAIATSKDLKTFKKHGIITPKIKYHDYESLINFSGEKLNPKYHTFYKLFKEIGLGNDSQRFLRIRALTLFPRKINGKFALLLSIYPGIQIVYFDKFSDLTMKFWIDYFENISEHIVLDPSGVYEVNYVGVGCVPIETNEGWLFIYFGAQETTTGIRNHIKVALLDIDNPKRILSRLKKPLFSPHKLLKEKPQMSDMVFPTGHALFGKSLYIYYGVSNKFIAVASVNIDELLHELRDQEKGIKTKFSNTISNL